MGWRLAEEVAWARPERPGPEWWTLLDLAQDANDDTRQGFPGHEYLAARGKCSRRTIDRHVMKLITADLLKVKMKAAPGRRVVYEILVLHGGPVDNPATCDSVNGTRQRATETGQRATETGGTCDSVSGAPPVTTPVTTPVINQRVLTSPVPVERARARSIQDLFSDSGRPSPRTAEETAAEARRQADELTEWMRQHPEAAQ
jgi:hypothetical protein